MTMAKGNGPDMNVLGYVVGETQDLESSIRALGPGETLHLRSAELHRRSPVLAVEDDSWRTGIEA